jgi:hypothetical protein
MNELLKAINEKPSDPIRQGPGAKVLPYVVNELAGPPGTREPSNVLGGGPPLSFKPLDLLDEDLVARAEEPSVVAQGATHEATIHGRGRATIFERLQTPVEGGEFGHESVTAFFTHAELTEYDGQEWSSFPHRLINGIRAVEGLGRDYRRVSFTVPDSSRWWWLRCENEWAEYGFLFPPTNREKSSVEFAVESVVSNGQIDARGTLAKQNTPYVASAANLWHLYSGIDKAHAFERLITEVHADRDHVDAALDILYDKWESPLAATIGAMILLHGKGNRDSKRWTENLAHRVAYTSDAAIFVLQRMVQDDSFNIETARACLARIQELGLPFTSEAFSYMVNMATALTDTRPGSLFLAVAASARSKAKGHLREHLLGLHSEDFAPA